MDFLKSIWARLYSFAVKYPLATIATPVIIVLASIAWEFGLPIQVGGIIGWLWGKKQAPTPDVVLIPPDGRKDDDGNVIQPGQPDEHGFVQPLVEVVIPAPHVFSDPDVVVVQHPTKGEVVLPLPKGVKNTDVQKIVEISPNVYQIANSDGGVDARRVLDDLSK